MPPSPGLTLNVCPVDHDVDPNQRAMSGLWQLILALLSLAAPAAAGFDAGDAEDPALSKEN